MPKRIDWNPKKLAHAVSVLKQHHDPAAALADLGMSPNLWNALDMALRRHGKGSASSHLKAAPVEFTDVAAARTREERRATAADVRELQRKLVELEQAADFYTRITTIPAITINRSRPKSGLRVATPVDMASDWHVGEVVTAEETLGRNTYDLAEAERRAAKYWDNVLWLREHDKKTRSCEDHVLILGGDLISGSIHPELAETNEVPLIEQVERAIGMIRPGIVELARDCRRLVIPCVHGNHGRFVTKSPVKTGWAVSLEALLYRWLRDSLSEFSNIEWLIPRAEGCAIDVHGKRIQIQHGTQLKSSGGIGGILVPLTRWATRSASAHLYVVGHFHQACWFDQVIVNGSLIGDSAYSKWHGMSFRPPEQVRFVIDEKRGLRSFDPVSVT